MRVDIDTIRFPLLSETLEKLTSELNIVLGVPVAPSRTIVGVWADLQLLRPFLQHLSDLWFNAVPLRDFCVFEGTEAYQIAVRRLYSTQLYSCPESRNYTATEWYERLLRAEIIIDPRLIPRLFDAFPRLLWNYGTDIPLMCWDPDTKGAYPVRTKHRIPILEQGQYKKYYFVEDGYLRFHPLVPEEMLFYNDKGIARWRERSEKVERVISRRISP